VRVIGSPQNRASADVGRPAYLRWLAKCTAVMVWSCRLRLKPAQRSWIPQRAPGAFALPHGANARP
jgi:hypothetical protein